MPTNKTRKPPAKAVAVFNDSQGIRDRCDHKDPWLMTLTRFSSRLSLAGEFKAVIVCRNCGTRLEGIVRARS
jgi:hypothetical protein